MALDDKSEITFWSLKDIAIASNFLVLSSELMSVTLSLDPGS